MIILIYLKYLYDYTFYLNLMTNIISIHQGEPKICRFYEYIKWKV